MTEAQRIPYLRIAPLATVAAQVFVIWPLLGFWEVRTGNLSSQAHARHMADLQAADPTLLIQDGQPVASTPCIARKSELN
jgi:hypothetical protein